jgi:hypothetical protein
MKVIRFSLLLLMLLLLVTASASAQMSASLVGTVTSNNAPLPGVTVTISSPNMQGTRTAITGDGGGYNFASIPPGEYRVEFSLSGLQTVSKQVRIGVAQTGRADADMTVATVAEAITVTATTPSVLETPTVSQNLSAKLADDLPIGRGGNYLLDTALLAPGVNDSTIQGRNGGQLQISGGPGYDNLVLVNGVAITEAIRRQAQPLFIEDAIQETTVMTGAISAEYGGFTGGVVNSITKSGGNEFTGSLRDSFTNPKWTAKTPTQTTENTDSLSQIWEATLGGFILRDRLWFFGAGRDTETTQLPSITRIVPGDTTRTQFSRTPVVTQRRLEGKLTGQITSKHNLSASYLDVNAKTTNDRFTAVSYDVEQFTNREDPRELTSLFYNGILTNNLMVEARYSDMFYGIGWGGGGQHRDFVQGTIVRNLNDSLARFNSATFCGVCDKETRTNDGWAGKTSYFLSTRDFGNHNFVAGLESFSEHRFANNYQSGSNFRFFVNGVTRVGENLYPRVNPGRNTIWGSSRSDAFLVWTPIFDLQDEDSDLQTDSIFINDRWDLNDKWSFSIGARYDRNNAIDASGTTVSDDQKISPRLNVTFDPFGNGRHRFTASYADYASRVVDGPATDGASGGNPAYIYFAYTGPALNQPGNPTQYTTREVLAMVEQWFNSQCDAQGRCGTDNPELLSTGVGHSVPGYDARVARTLGSPYVRELTLGYGIQIAANAVARVDLISRDWKDFYASRIDRSTPQENDFLGIGHDIAIIENTNLVSREYRGIQFQSNWRPRRFNIGLNYTWSTLRGSDEQETVNSGTVGNFPGSMYYPELRDFARYQPEGYIANQDQRHKARLWIGYDLPLPRLVGLLNVSLLQRYDSGVPYSALTQIDLSPYEDELLAGTTYVSAPLTVQYYFSDRGAFRTEDVHATDLSVNYRYPIGRFEIFAQGELVNAFNRGAVVVVNTSVNQLADFNPFTETPVEGVHWAKGSLFGQAPSASSVNFQTMRTYRLSAGIRF